jgi:hypothetical protein
MTIVELRRALRKAGVPVYREIRNKGTRVGTVNSSRYKPSLTQKAGIELFQYKNDSGYSIRYDKGWKNDPIHTNEEIYAFINKTIEVLEALNVGRVDVKESR